MYITCDETNKVGRITYKCDRSVMFYIKGRMNTIKHLCGIHAELYRKKGRKIYNLSDNPEKTKNSEEYWQMTKEEWGRIFRHPGYGGKMMTSITGPAFSHRIRQTTKHFRSQQNAEAWLNKEHKYLIKKALAEGKPVPAKVLKEYPQFKGLRKNPDQSFHFKDTDKAKGWKPIIIDGVEALTKRDKDAPTHFKWSIVEAKTGLSLMPTSFPGRMSAGTLKGAIYLAQREIERHGGGASVIEEIKSYIKRLNKGLNNPANPNYEGIKNPNELYESFHGVAPSTKKTVYYEPPQGDMLSIGELTQLNYKPTKGQHKSQEFFHKSGDTGDKKLPTNLILCTDKGGKNIYLVKKNKNSKFPLFTDRGIIG